MSKLKNEVLALKDEGYAVKEIADELGIPETKVKELGGFDEMDAPLDRSKNEKRSQESKLRSCKKLKTQYDELIADYAENLDAEEVGFGTAHQFLEDVRKLEFQFRNTARDFSVNHENSEHWQALKSWIEELKDKIKEAKNDARDRKSVV